MIERTGPGRDESLLSDRIAGIKRSRQETTKVAECICCGELTTDFITYDAGPFPVRDHPDRRLTVNLCVKLWRDPKTQFLLSEEPFGCNRKYSDHVAKLAQDGKLGADRFMHDILREFVRRERPSVTFPDPPSLS